MESPARGLSRAAQGAGLHSASCSKLLISPRARGITRISASAGLRDRLATHEEDQGLDENDFIMAEKLDRMVGG